MSDLFGAPVGIEASERTMRENALAGAQSLRLMGEIEQQPAQGRLLAAHARYYESAADLAAAKARDAATLQQLGAETAAARGQGIDLTSADVPAATRPQPTSMADPLEQMYQLGVKKGISPTILAPLAEKAALIHSHEAAALSSQSEQQVRQIDAQQKQLELTGQLAQMGLQGPQGYDQMRMTAAAMGRPIDHLPQSYTEAIPVLQNMVASALKVKDQLDLQQKQIKEKAQEKRWAAENAKDSAYVALSKARRDKAELEYKTLLKNGGKDSPDVVDARKALTERRRQLNEANNRKEFPPAPLDPSARQPEQSYTAADGKTRFKWTKDPTTGTYRAMVLSGPAAVAPAKETNQVEEDAIDAGTD